eukprot:6145138-Pyramimonas_sp.AAC.1
MILRHSGPGEILLGVDCQSLLDVWARCPHQNVTDIPFGEYWEEVIARARDRGEDQTALFKVPAHKSWWKAAALGCPARAWHGNQACDFLARKAAANVPH